MRKIIPENEHYVVQGSYISPIAKEILKSESLKRKIKETKLAGQIIMEWAVKTGHNTMNDLEKEIENGNKTKI